MGIFGKLFNRNESTSDTANYEDARQTTPTSSEIPSDGVILNLNKGDILDLTKYSDTLTKVRAAAGWQINQSNGPDYDLDLCAYIMEGGQVRHVVYYADKKTKYMYLDGDNLTGSTGQNDDENIHVNLDKVPDNIDRIVFAVVIYQARNRGQKFGKVKDAYMRLVDESSGKEICRYKLSDDGGDNTAAVLASLNRTGGSWSFEAIGKYSKDSIESLQTKV